MKMLFGSIVAGLLLALYVYPVSGRIGVIDCVAAGRCTAAAFTQGMASTLALTSGLVSALVIAGLAVTEPGEAPVARALGGDSSSRAISVVKVVTGLYLLLWLATGLWAFVVEYLKHPEALPAITGLGQAWLGIVLAAGYSYFRIRPPSRQPQRQR